MKKILGIIIGTILSVTMAIANDYKFIQIDNLMYEPQNTTFADLVKDINKQKNIGFVVFSGNNISKPDREYLEQFLKEANKLKVPYYVVIGNKDVNKQKGLGKADYLKIVSKYSKSHKKIDKPNYVFEKKGIIFIVVDGAKDVIPSSMGYYKTETLNWLEAELNLYQNKNVVIIQHFPLIPPAQKETHYTFKTEDYLKMLSAHSNVKALVSGHFGVNKETNLNGIIHISTTSAPTYRIIDISDIETPNPTFWSVIKEK
jgi:predicted phosphodiesterase